MAISSADSRKPPTASAIGTPAALATSIAAPGVDQAVTTGIFQRHDRPMQVRPMPMPSAHIHELVCAGVAPSACAAGTRSPPNWRSRPARSRNRRRGWTGRGARAGAGRAWNPWPPLSSGNVAAASAIGRARRAGRSCAASTRTPRNGRKVPGPSQRSRAMDRTMKAAVVRAFGQPLVIEEVAVPRPGPGDVLVKIEACGVCHTDLHAAEGDWPVKPAPPFIPGHEGVGHVVAVGAGVTHVKEGDRVGIPGCTRPAATANTAWAAGKRCARRSRTPATRSTAVSPSTRWPMPAMSATCPRTSASSRSRRCCARA